MVEHPRPLTTSLDSTKEWLPMNTSLFDCSALPAATSNEDYQARARREFARHTDRDVPQWAWVLTTCDRQCLNVQHMMVHSPIRIAYPVGVCIYCGMPAGTKDHLVPAGWTGENRRPFVAVVPACADCNRRISDLPECNVDVRRKRAQDSLRRTKKAILKAPRWTDADLDEYGPSLRSFMVAKRAEREVLENRLAWPFDPFYDLRAWQKSGIKDPVAIDMIADMLGEQWTGVTV